MGLLNFKVGLDTSNFNAGLKRMRAGFNGWAKSAASGIGGQIAGAMALERVVGSVASLYEEAARIQRDAFNFGISTDEVQALGKAARLSQVDIDGLSSAMEDLNVKQYDAIEGSKDAQQIFSKYGIQFGAPDGPEQIRQPSELLQELASAMQTSGLSKGEIQRDLDELMSEEGKRLQFGIMKGYFNNLDSSRPKFTAEQIEDYAGARQQALEARMVAEKKGAEAMTSSQGGFAEIVGRIYGDMLKHQQEAQYDLMMLQLKEAKEANTKLNVIKKGFE